MKPLIRAIIFDVGGTLRVTDKRSRTDFSAIRELQQVIGDSDIPDDFIKKIHQREKTYRKWCKRSLIELSEVDLWSKFLLPGLPEQVVRENAVHFNQLWRDQRDKSMLPDAVQTIKTLAKRGFKLAIVSNTTSSTETPIMLAANGLTDLFNPVILSTVFGRRKPHPSLFLEAARGLGIPPTQCAYIGDNLARDLVGARQAGFGEVVIINGHGYREGDYDPDEEALLEPITAMKADYHISTLSELLDLFPACGQASPTVEEVLTEPNQLYDAGLSTMWHVDQNLSFNDTFKAARSLGFARFELNHKVPPGLLAQFDADHYYISTVHDPCPALLTYSEMKHGDIQISSLDESKRQRSLDFLKKTLDLARSLGSKSIVIHPGAIACDPWRDYRMRELFEKGQVGSDEYRRLSDEMVADRAARIAPHLDMVIKSLQAFISYASGSSVAVGLENRYRYYDIPLPNELKLLLGLCDEDWFGFQYDVGHAQTLHALGLIEHDTWLESFSRRMIGVHLHDVIGVRDHQVPGVGDVDFAHIAPYIPLGAWRTLEISPHASLPDLAKGLDVLHQSGCIQKI